MAGGAVGEGAGAEGIGNVGGRLVASDGCGEGSAREEADGLRYGGLEEAAVRGVREAVARERLAEGEEGGEEPDARKWSACCGGLRAVWGMYLFGNARSWLARLQRKLSGLNMYRNGRVPQTNGSSNLNNANGWNS